MKKKALKESVTSSLIWSFGERFTAQLVSFIVSIVLARIIAPEHFGSIALVNVFITICNVFVSSGFGNALIQKKEADERDYSTVFVFSISLSIVMYISMFFVAEPIATFYNDATLCNVIRVMSLRLPLAAVNSIQHAYISKRLEFKKFFFSTLIGTVISALAGIVLAIRGFGIWALVVQYLTNSTIDTIVLWFTVPWRPKLIYSSKRMKSLFSFGWKLLVASLLSTVYNEIRDLIIGKKYSSADLAYYNRGKTFPSLIVTNINVSISKVLFPVIASEQDRRESVKSMTRRSIRISSYIMLPLLSGLALLANPVVKLLLGEKWLFCVPYLQIYCFIYFLMPIQTANQQVISAMGRSDIYLVLQIIKISAGAVILLGSIFLFDSPISIAYGALISAVLNSIVNTYPNKSLLAYSYIEQIKDILPSASLTAVMGICVYVIGLFNLPTFIGMILQVIVGATIYIAISAMIGLEDFKYLLSIAGKFIRR